MSDSHLTEPMLLAAQLIAEAKLTHDEIAKRVGLSRQAVYAWRKKPEFAAEVERALDERRREIRRTGIADLEARVAALNDRWTRMRRLMEARADDPSMAKVPGGTTGLLVRTVKGLGSGEAFTLVEEYAVDTGLLRELREHEKQAAQELGQWTEKSQSSVELQGNSPIRKIQIQYLPPREIGDGAGE
jgi:AcrR family transcriptional regulator